MTNLNNNNLPKIETVYELKNEIPSFEEFMKTYKTDEENEFLAEAEYQDQALHGPRFGPGNSQSSENVTKKVISGALAISYVIPPLAPVGIGVSVGIGVTGLAMNKLSDDPEVKKAGEEMVMVVANAVEYKDMAGNGVDAARTYNQLRR